MAQCRARLHLDAVLCSVRTEPVLAHTVTRVWRVNPDDAVLIASSLGDREGIDVGRKMIGCTYLRGDDDRDGAPLGNTRKSGLYKVKILYGTPYASCLISILQFDVLNPFVLSVIRSYDHTRFAI